MRLIDVRVNQLSNLFVGGHTPLSLDGTFLLLACPRCHRRQSTSPDTTPCIHYIRRSPTGGGRLILNHRHNPLMPVDKTNWPIVSGDFSSHPLSDFGSSRPTDDRRYLLHLCLRTKCRLFLNLSRYKFLFSSLLLVHLCQLHSEL